MCDNSKKAIEIIKRNVEKTHTSEKVEIYETTYENLLKNKITNLLKELCVEITDIRKYGRAYLIFLRKKRKG